MKRQWNKAAASLLAAVMLVFSCPIPALAQEETVHIRTVQDLQAFAKSCTLDSWSRGKTAVLEADLDLTGVSFSGIPTFGGVFDGGGHTVSGLSLTGDGGTQGLFRSVQKGAVVQDLRVEGTVSPTGTRDIVGGVAGRNEGTLLRCSFSGTVRGGTDAGGIAGRNEAGGELTGCTFEGSLSGELHAGGVVGQNLGSAVECINLGSVNTTQLEEEATAQTVLEESSVTDAATDLSGWTDVGGVAGYSAGILQNCRNEGSVGYPHIGYNAGGVAGRQSGLLDGCTNSGSVQGRKDVGGIVGQLEPEVTLLYSQTFLQKLGDELSTLQTKTDALLNDAGNVSGNLSASLSALSDRTDEARAAANALSGAAADWADEGTGQLNDLSARVSRALNLLDPALANADDQLRTLSQAAGKLSDAMDEAERLGRLTGKSLQSARAALRDLETALEKTRAALKDVQTAGQELRASLGNLSEMKQAAEKLLAACETLNTTVTGGLQTSAAALRKALDEAQLAVNGTDDLAAALGSASDDLARALSGLADSSESLHSAAQELTNGPSLHIPALNGDVTQKADDLNASLSALTQAANDLNAAASGSSDSLLGDLRNINQQMGVIASLIQDEGSRQADAQDRYEDVSDPAQLRSQRAGRVSACRNTGAVEGDLNTAGIAGSMAIDLEFDPEDDLTQKGDRSVSFLIQTMAAVFDCVNEGTVTVKKDCAGGIVGRMDLGMADGCESYGDVKSTGGSYAGGVAGDAAGAIRSCWSRCTVTGKHNVGGIAGRSASLTDCRSAAQAHGESKTGAIAGELMEDATASGCLYAEGLTAAIDGVSYAGQAESIAFSDLCALPDAPENFSNLTLTFTDGESVVATLTVPYGGALDSLPEIPAREGCSASWPALDYSCITASRTIEAVYTPYRSALSDGSEPAQILAEGRFGTAAKLSAVSEESTWQDASGASHTGTVWTVTVTDPELGVSSRTLHCRLPEDGSQWQLWVRGADGWQKQDFTIDGSYLLFPTDGEETTFCVLPGDFPVLPAAAAAGAALVVLAAGILLLRRRRKHKKAS